MHRTWPNPDSTLQFFIEASLCCLQRQTRPENTQKKNELLIIICEAEGKQKSLDAVFNLPSVFSNKESVFVFPPFFFSSAFSSAFSSRIILMASVRPSCHTINRFHKYPPPHVLYNCFRFLVKILVNTSDKSAELQKMRRGKNRGRESKADRWTTNVEESSPAEKYSKVWSSIPSMLHFFFPPFKFIFLLQLDSEYLCWHSVLQQFNFLPIFPEFRLDFSHFHVAALYLDELVWTAGLVQDFLIQAVHIFYITEKCFDAPQVCKTQFRSFVDPRKHHHTASRQALKYVFSLNSSCYATNMNSIQKCLTT